jgi:plasmid stability protein
MRRLVPASEKRKTVARKTETLRPVMTRIPEGLRRRLEREAARNGRSMNTEIIHRLQRTLAIDDSTAATNMLDFLRELGVDITNANEKDVAVAVGKLVSDRFLGMMPIRETKSHKGGDK